MTGTTKMTRMAGMTRDDKNNWDDWITARKPSFNNNFTKR